MQQSYLKKLTLSQLVKKFLVFYGNGSVYSEVPEISQCLKPYKSIPALIFFVNLILLLLRFS
jgi:hypothetical protein